MKFARFRLLFLFLIALHLSEGFAYNQTVQNSSRITIELSSQLSQQPISGRLLVFMTQSAEALKVVQPSLFELEKVWVAAREIRNLEPGKPIEFDADTLSYPTPFSAAPAGDYQIMALLDTNHSFPYSEMGPGDLRSQVAKFSKGKSDSINLVLDNRIEEQNSLAETESVKVVSFQSPSLSAFWGRPIRIRAAVLLPTSYATSKRRYPTVYKIHGFGGSHLRVSRDVAGLLRKMSEGLLPEMIYVYLDGSCPMGHHEFADSANNGPWGKALTTEFVPYLESKFRMDAVARGRLLTGHSSGGWSSLWLQVNYPDFFGGTWSTAPDPVDFRSFSDIDLTKIPADNFYYGPSGKPRNIFRYKGHEMFSWKQYASFARVIGEYGGQLESFEAVFSPRGEDGRPMPLFDRDSGTIDPIVQKAWERYDISRLLVANWKSLSPKLRGKLHIIVGTADNFHLEKAVYLLHDTLKQLGSDATFQFLDGRDHMDLYQGDLADRIAREMYKVARPASKN